MAATVACCAASPAADKIKYGDMNSWVTRTIKESAVLGGNTKTLYEIGPGQTIDGAKPYTNLGGSPWATSNVYAKVMGVVKCSNAVYPDTRTDMTESIASAGALWQPMKHLRLQGFYSRYFYRNTPGNTDHNQMHIVITARF